MQALSVSRREKLTARVIAVLPREGSRGELVIDDYDRGWCDGRKALQKHSKNTERDVNDPKVPPSVADRAVYLRGWQEAWFAGS